MKRADRLMALVLHLRHGWVQAETLAHEYGVSVRTIYRDMQGLTEAGVPVLGEAGRGYRLMDGYFLPPLHLTLEEAVMVSLGLGAVRGAFDAEYAAAAERAARKLDAALPDGRRAEVRRLLERVQLIESEEARYTPTLRGLRGAVLTNRSVRFRYHAPGGVSERHADPLRLVRMNGVWMLSAHDHARGGHRTFRLDRIENLQPGEAATHVTPPAARSPGEERRALRIRLRFAPQMERWVRERPNYYQVDETSGPDGYELGFQVRGVADLLPWVLSWGAAVQVLEPPELAERLKEEARRRLADSS